MEELSENSNVEKKRFFFKKEEHLCSKKIIDKLFAEGGSFLSFPLKFVFLKTKLPSDYLVQVGFSVGKKIFKKAVLRNLIKRRMREAYRLNKNDLIKNIEKEQLALFIIFIGKSIPDYKKFEDSMKSGLKKLKKEIVAKETRER